MLLAGWEDHRIKGAVGNLCKFTLPFLSGILGVECQRWEVSFPM